MTTILGAVFIAARRLHISARSLVGPPGPITRLGAGWVSFDVAGGRSSIAAFAPQQREKARVVAIGRDVDEVRLRAAFEACATPYMQAA